MVTLCNRRWLWRIQYQTLSTTSSSYAPPQPPPTTATSSFPHEQSEHSASSVVSGLAEFLLKGAAAWKDAPPCTDYIGPVKVDRTADGRGRGLFATTDVKAGRLLLISNALAVSYNDPAKVVLYSKLISLAKRNSNILRKIYALASSHASQSSMSLPSLDFLCSNFENEAPSCINDEETYETIQFDGKRIMDTMMLNSFEGEFPSGDKENEKTRFSGLWLIPSLINHSCLRNASKFVVGKAMIIHAAKDIKAEEEITISYVDAMAPLLVRRNAYETMKFGFTCNCQRCVLERSFESSLNHASQMYVDLHKKSMDELHQSMFAQKPLKIEDSFPACCELWNLFQTVQKTVTSFDELSKLQQQWILAGYSSAFLCKWLVTGYCTNFEKKQMLVNQSIMELVDAMRATVPGLLQTLSLITLLVGLAQRIEGNERAARMMFDVGMDECIRTYGDQKLDVLVKLMEKSTEVIPFF